MVKFPLAAAILFAGAGAMSKGSSVVISMMIDRVNSELPEDQQISHSGNYPGKVIDIKEQYRRFHPEGSLPKILNLLEALGVVMFVISFVLFLQFVGYL